MTDPANNDAALVREALAWADKAQADLDGEDGRTSGLSNWLPELIAYTRDLARRLQAAAERADELDDASALRREEEAWKWAKEWKRRAERAEATNTRLRKALNLALMHLEDKRAIAAVRAALAQDAEQESA